MKFTSKQARKSLHLRPNAIGYEVNCRLHQLYPKLAIECSSEDFFDLEAFARDGHCTLAEEPQLLSQIEMNYQGLGKKPGRRPVHYAYRVTWRGQELIVLQLTWNSGRYGTDPHQWMLAENAETICQFFQSLMDYQSEVRGEILVFNGGCFSKDEQLFQDIQSSVLDNLVLHGRVKEELVTDCHSFFASQELYQQYGVPWKRGYLLIGPPGNGKSHTIKALLNDLQRPCIYVQSFKSEHETDHEVMRQLFKRVRTTTPCILVLEDLDSLINDGNRSFFLNELDGFAANHGILTLATTNHPELLDPAILERPSRFDRKYFFGLPERMERLAYLKLWNCRLEKKLRATFEGLEKLADVSDGFSYAYLKELVLSSMMAWMRSPGQRTMEEVMLEVAGPLASQLARPNIHSG